MNAAINETLRLWTYFFARIGVPKIFYNGGGRQGQNPETFKT